MSNKALQLTPSRDLPISYDRPGLSIHITPELVCRIGVAELGVRPFKYAPQYSPHQENRKRVFHVQGRPTDFKLLDFWATAFSDQLTNMNRGVLAEYLVLKALELTDTVMNDYEAFDALTPDGRRIEVKSSAYIQRWPQKKPSSIKFSVRQTRFYDYQQFDFVGEPVRHSHIYVFALLTHTDKGTVDPLDLSQWTFYIVPTSTVNRVVGSAASITLATLISRLSPIKTDFFGLKDAIYSAPLETTMA